MEKFKENEITQYYYPGYMDDYDKIVQSYIKYYHIRAQKCKQFYYAFTIIKIALAASIPVLQMISVVKKYPVILAIVSAAIVVIESFLVMTRSVEKWSLFRNNCNRLLQIQRVNAIKCADSQSLTDEREFIFRKWRVCLMMKQGGGINLRISKGKHRRSYCIPRWKERKRPQCLLIFLWRIFS